MHKILTKLFKNYVSVKEEHGPPGNFKGRYQDIARDGIQYIRRFFIWRRMLGTSAFVHRIYTADPDEWIHDHPWSFSIAIVLSGWYMEERVKHLDPFKGAVLKTRKVRFLNIIRGRDFHRISEVGDNTWTLFIHFGRTKEWGFLRRCPVNLAKLPGYEGPEEKRQEEVLIYYQPYMDFYAKYANDREAAKKT